MAITAILYHTMPILGNVHDLWQYTDTHDGRKWTCSFCKKEFSGGLARLSAHLTSSKGKGIVSCLEIVSTKALDAASIVQATNASKLALETQ